MGFRNVSLVLATFLFTGCATVLDEPPLDPHGDFLLDYFDAFNAHDVDGLKQFWAEDIQWLDMSAPCAEPVARSADELGDMMVQYFSTHPDVRSSPSQAIVTEGSIAFVETAQWSVQGESKSQTALAIYELDEGRITRFWYIGEE